jgi:hypothetical protein
VPPRRKQEYRNEFLASIEAMDGIVGDWGLGAGDWTADGITEAECRREPRGYE